MTFHFENKQIVAPGDLLAEGDYATGENTFKEENKIFAIRLGLVQYEGKKVSVVALNTFYVPAIGDQVIGKVIEASMSGWDVDINAPYIASLRASEVLNKPFRPQRDDLTKILDIGDLVLAKIIQFDRTHDPSLTVQEPGLGKIAQGQIVKVSPAKIPRIIGRKASMITMLKKETGCRITVGQNGIILISGGNPEDERLAMMAVQKIEQEAHTSGLTDRVSEMISKERGVVKE